MSYPPYLYGQVPVSHHVPPQASSVQPFISQPLSSGFPGQPYALPSHPMQAPNHAQMSQYPQQPPMAQRPPPQQIHLPTSRILNIQSVNIGEPCLQICDQISGQHIYSVVTNKRDLFSSKPHLSINSGTTGQSIASVRFHSMSEDIDLEIHGRPIKFKSSSLGLTSSHEFSSRAAGGAKFKWKKTANCFQAMEIQCLDPSGKVVASFRATGENKQGYFELDSRITLGSIQMDELVVSGIAMVKWKQRHSEYTAAGAEAAGNIASIGGGGA